METDEAPAEMICVFFALIPDEAAIDSLKRQLAGLKQILPESPIRWVRPENLHLTLRFLGDQRMGRPLQNLIAEAELVLSEEKSIFLQIGQPRLFPNRCRPVVVTAEIADSESLRALAGKMDRVALRCGGAADRHGFNPHVTLGRIKRGSRVRLPETEDGGGVKSLASEVVLMKSELTSEGPVYSPVHRFPLRT